MGERYSFEAEGKSYDLCYTIERIDLFEEAHGPFVMMYVSNGTILTTAQLIELMAVGIRERGGSFVNPADGKAMALNILMANDYYHVFQAVYSALSKDVPFLFPKETLSDSGD